MAGPMITITLTAVLAGAVGESPTNADVISAGSDPVPAGHCEAGENCTEFSNVHVLTLGDPSDSIDEARPSEPRSM